MRVQDLPLTCAICGVLLLLIVVVTSALVAQHTDVPVPRLLAGPQIRPVQRRSLVITVPWIVLVLGGGQAVVALFLVHPDSTVAVRVVSAAEILAAGAWLWYLGRLVRHRP